MTTALARIKAKAQHVIDHPQGYSDWWVDWNRRLLIRLNQ